MGISSSDDGNDENGARKVNIEFILKGSTQYLTYSLCSLVRYMYQVEHKKRNSISTSNNALYM